MPPVPPLALAGKASLHTIGIRSSRGGARGSEAGGALASSPRHIIRPDVGYAAMISALGDIKPAWEQRPPTTPRTGDCQRPATSSYQRPATSSYQRPVTSGVVATPRSVGLTPRNSGMESAPYNVGRNRARCQLEIALRTLDATAQLRRLDLALETSVAVYEKGFVEPSRLNLAAELQTRRANAAHFGRLPDGGVADSSVEVASATVHKQVAPQSVPPVGQAWVEEGSGKVPDNAIVADREEDGTDEAAVHKEAAEALRKKQQDAAATKIQSIRRGKAARASLKTEHAPAAEAEIEVLSPEDKAEA